MLYRCNFYIKVEKVIVGSFFLKEINLIFQFQVSFQDLDRKQLDFVKIVQEWISQYENFDFFLSWDFIIYFIFNINVYQVLIRMVY